MCLFIFYFFLLFYYYYYFCWFTTVEQSTRVISWLELNIRHAQTSGLLWNGPYWHSCVSNQVVSFQLRINAVLFALWMRTDLERQIFHWRFFPSDMQTRMAWFSAFDQHLHHCQLENKLVQAFIVHKVICTCEGLAPEVFCWTFKTCHNVLFWKRGKDKMFMHPDEFYHAQADRTQEVW